MHQGPHFVTEVPVARLVDADQVDIVLVPVDGLEDGGGGSNRYLVLTGAAAEQDAQVDFVSHGWIVQKPVYKTTVIPLVLNGGLLDTGRA